MVSRSRSFAHTGIQWQAEAVPAGGSFAPATDFSGAVSLPLSRGIPGRPRETSAMAIPLPFHSRCFEPVKTPYRHRNVTIKRLVLDACQFVRCQSFVTGRFGKPFSPSRFRVEIDITYKCHLRCLNCNRSCTQAPSDMEMPVSDIEQFIRKSIEKKMAWQRIRILGGEPTLHSRFSDIVELLVEYKKTHNPALNLVLGTSYHGTAVHRALKKLPDAVSIISTRKTSRMNLFRPFNVAPIDTIYNRFSDYTCGCRIMEDCGLGVTPFGYYMCAVAGGMDRIFRFRMGRDDIPDASDDLSDQTSAFCPLCGHFGFQWPTRRTKMSTTWRKAYGLEP